MLQLANFIGAQAAAVSVVQVELRAGLPAKGRGPPRLARLWCSFILRLVAGCAAGCARHAMLKLPEAAVGLRQGRSCWGTIHGADRRHRAAVVGLVSGDTGRQLGDDGMMGGTFFSRCSLIR